MKLVSFSVSTPVGPMIRVGAVAPNGNYVDLQVAYRSLLITRDVAPAAAARIAAATIPSDMAQFIEGGELSLAAAREALAWESQDRAGMVIGTVSYRPEDVHLLAPIPRPPLIRDFMAFETHLKNIYPKLNREIPPEWYEMPVYYKGNPGSIGGDGDEVVMPYGVDRLDYEFEIALVIGKAGRDIPRERAMDHVYGFMIYNDFSERTIQGREMAVGLGPAKGKDFAGGHVFGPWLVTIDELPDPENLRMTSRINGEVQTEDSTATMHWKYVDLIVHASRGESLAVGEIFGSGTVGNGSGAELGRWLGPGDAIELEVEGLGVLRNTIA
jgi:2-keto-4-pentenoate hydratase/2-oxohepta-3-ene-1,7-dioic acid hydratase in catechol pathway